MADGDVIDMLDVPRAVRTTPEEPPEKLDIRLPAVILAVTPPYTESFLVLRRLRSEASRSFSCSSITASAIPWIDRLNFDSPTA